MFGQKRRARNRNIGIYLAALRSGEYKQTRHRLSRYNAEGVSYCALGLLGKVVSGNPQRGYTDGETLFGPSGISTSQIWCWNDAEQLTFPQIADRLERLVKEKA